LLKNKELIKSATDKTKILNFDSYINSKDFDKKIKDLIKKTNTSSDLESSYKEMLKYKEIFLRIYKEILEIKTKLNIK
jgi:hypothetical protein